jgi:hypothetical protein
VKAFSLGSFLQPTVGSKETMAGRAVIRGDQRGRELQRVRGA